MKTCSKCKKEKEVSEFPKNPQTKDGLSSWCKLCKNEDSRRHYPLIAVSKRLKDRIYRRKVRKEVFAHYGTSCACCGETHEELLTIDHIKGGGNKHRKELAIMGYSFYRWLRKMNYPEGYATLCYNCNCSRAHAGYCPHEWEYIT